MTALRPHGLGAGSVSALGAPGVDPIDVAVPLLLNELESATDAVVLVLDDYHLLSDPRVHEGVEFLLAYLPASMRLVVAGRTDPPLPLARLRARGELTEIRAEDLRFSRRRGGGARGGPSGTVELDARRCTGCASGPRAGRPGCSSPRSPCAERPAPAAAVDAIRGDDRHILDYFTAEVVRRAACCRTVTCWCGRPCWSGCPGRCATRCCSAPGRPRSSTTLGRADLFVVALDRRQEWYRCHRLFRDCPAPPARSGRGAGRPRPGRRLVPRAGATSRTPSSTASSRVTTRARPSCSGRSLPVVPRARRLGHLQAGRPARARCHRTPTRPCASRWPGRPAIGGEFARMGRWLDAAEGRVDDGGPPRWDGTTCAARGDATRGAAPRRGRRRAGAGLRGGRHRPGDRPRRARLRDGPAPARNGLRSPPTGRPRRCPC